MIRQTYATAREIARTPGTKRRLAILTGCMMGAYGFINPMLQGWDLRICIFDAVFFAALTTPAAMYAIATGDVMQNGLATPHRPGTEDEMSALRHKLHVATLAMASASLVLSALSLYLWVA